MKNWLALLLLAASPLLAQNRVPVINLVGSDPTGLTCSPIHSIEQYQNSLFTCDSATGTWVVANPCPPSGCSFSGPVSGSSASFTGSVSSTGGFVGSLTGHASQDLPLTGGSLSGNLQLFADPPGGSAHQFYAASQHYVDTSQMQNVSNWGCSPSATTATNDACFNTIFNIIGSGTWFMPPGTYQIDLCQSLPLAQDFALIGAGYNATTIEQMTSGTCIIKTTSENTANFKLQGIEFSYVTQQVAATDEQANYPATAVLLDTTTRTSGGIYQFELSFLACHNATRCIATQKYTTGFGIPVWGLVAHDIFTDPTVNGAAINFMYASGSTGGQPRQKLYNIYMQQTASEPLIAISNADTVELQNIESDNGQDILLDLSEVRTGTVQGLHIEQYTQRFANTYVAEHPVVLLTNSNVSLKDVRITAHLCPTGTACAGATNPAFWLVLNNNPFGGSVHVENAIMDPPYSDSNATAQSFIAASADTALSDGYIGNESGFTACLEPGTTVSRYRYECGVYNFTALNVSGASSLTALNVSGATTLTGAATFKNSVDVGLNGSYAGAIELEPATVAHTVFWLHNVSGATDKVCLSNGTVPGINPVCVDGSGDLSLPSAAQLVIPGLGAATAPTCFNGPNGSLNTAGCVYTGVASGIVTLTSGTATVNDGHACTPATGCIYKLMHCGPNASTAIGTLSIGTVTVGTSFVINSLSATNTLVTGDASTVCWQLN